MVSVALKLVRWNRRPKSFLTLTPNVQNAAVYTSAGIYWDMSTHEAVGTTCTCTEDLRATTIATVCFLPE